MLVVSLLVSLSLIRFFFLSNVLLLREENTTVTLKYTLIHEDIFKENNADIPFSALYLVEKNKLVLKSTSIHNGHPAAPLEISFNGKSFPVPTLSFFDLLNVCLTFVYYS